VKFFCGLADDFIYVYRKQSSSTEPVSLDFYFAPTFFYPEYLNIQPMQQLNPIRRIRARKLASLPFSLRSRSRYWAAGRSGTVMAPE
jgi:hypothetical protein